MVPAKGSRVKGKRRTYNTPKSNVDLVKRRIKRLQKTVLSSRGSAVDRGCVSAINAVYERGLGSLENKKIVVFELESVKTYVGGLINLLNTDIEEEEVALLSAAEDADAAGAPLLAELWAKEDRDEAVCGDG